MTWLENPDREYDYRCGPYRVREEGLGRWVLTGPVSGVFQYCWQAKAFAEQAERVK
jgi:hypothetical protein